MSVKSINVSSITMLDDGETWSGQGYVYAFGLKEQVAFLKERGHKDDVGDLHHEEIDTFFWDELHEDKAVRDLDEVAECYSVDDLLMFYLMAEQLGLDKLVWDNVKASA